MNTAPTAPNGAAAGAALPRWELVGPAEAPLVIALGGISASAHVTATAADPSTGWWEPVVGAGRAVDTRRVRVLSIDWLDEASDQACDTVTTHDQAAAIVRLLDTLGEPRAHTVIGASYGGMVALALAERFAARVRQLVVISAAHESHPMTTALRSIQRRIVRLGWECDRVADAMAIARALAMTTYRTPREMVERFAPVRPERGPDGCTFAVERYLMRQGARFAERFNAGRFLALSLSADLHCVDPGVITTPSLLVAAEGDSLVPLEQMEQLADRLGAPARLVRLSSRVGHDAFLAEPDGIGPVLTAALDQEVLT